MTSVSGVAVVIDSNFVLPASAQSVEPNINIEALTFAANPVSLSVLN